MACGIYDYDPSTPQARQQRDWDCSAAATAWLGRSLGWGWEELDVAYQFLEQGIATQALGLLDGTGAGIVGWLGRQGMSASHAQRSWDGVLASLGSCPLIFGSSTWYHWCGVRGVDGSGVLQLANSAPGWGGIWQDMSASQFQVLQPFWIVKPTS